MRVGPPDELSFQRAVVPGRGNAVSPEPLNTGCSRGGSPQRNWQLSVRARSYGPFRNDN
jgi:hypothetical protein